MTGDEILAMEAGRELDALVAEKVLGIPKPIYAHHPELHHEIGRTVKVKGWFCQQEYVDGDVCKWYCKWYPNPYSSDIAAAWEVWELMRSKDKFGEWIDFCMVFGEQIATIEHYVDIMAAINPLNICRAALLAVMEA